MNSKYKILKFESLILLLLVIFTSCSKDDSLATEAADYSINLNMFYANHNKN
mgnify:CR=1 FL=1